MPRRSFSDGSRGDEQLIRQLPVLLRQHRADLMQEGRSHQRQAPRALAVGASRAVPRQMR